MGLSHLVFKRKQWLRGLSWRVWGATSLQVGLYTRFSYNSFRYLHTQRSNDCHGIKYALFSSRCRGTDTKRFLAVWGWNLWRIQFKISTELVISSNFDHMLWH